jgi:eukaryotic-like serine/threonine-protein kinase
MAVQCPYCRHEISPRPAPPGMYTTVCPGCGRKFYLAVPEDPRQSPVAAPIPGERDRVTRVSTGQPPVVLPPSVRAGEVDSKVSDAPVMTLPEHARSTPTLAGPAEPGRAFGGDAVAPVVRAPSTTWAQLGPGSIPRLLGGYIVLSERSQAAMGPEYLARHLWLGTNVTLKVMKLLWARNAPFVARFTREAYAAAQLNHYNLAPIRDFGEAKGTTYFCTEYVDGQTLAELTGQKKRLGAEEAAAYVLQAARGLRHAHDQSLIHRDIKPENLLLNRQGLVKVADLGLVNTPELAEAIEAISAGKAPPGTAADGSGKLTSADGTVGTPSYMAPEQARDAARVDARADIYSLGATLYFLVAGCPPFAGRSALEILNKHQAEPITPPDQLVKGVPGSLSAIILKMLAKKPEDRYSNLSEVIDALEGFLGVSSTASFTPREEQANVLDECVKTFNASRSARLRSWLLPGVLGACFALALISLLTGRLVGAGVFATLGLWTALADFVLVGIRRKTPLFVKLCDLISTGGLSEWLTAVAGIAILVVLLMILKLFWIWLGLAFLAIGIAVAFHAAFDRQVEAERSEPLDKVERMLRSIRLQGHDEDALRQFVCKYCGNRWEEFYEALFGYEAKREARDRWGRDEGGRLRPRFAACRDLIANWLDGRIAARREARETSMLWKIEERNLQSLGENLVTARRKARRSALAMVATAAEIEGSTRPQNGTILVNRSIAWSMREAAVTPEKVLLDHERGLLPVPDRERSSLVGGAVTLLLGPKVRFLAGAALLAGCIAWMHQNSMISAEYATALVEAAKSGDVEGIQSHAQASVAHARDVAAQPTQSLDLPGVPPGLLAIVSSFGAGVGGLILIVSSLFQGIRITFFAIPAAAIPVLLARLWHPAVGGLDPSVVPSIVGAAILAAGLLFTRR